MLKQIAAISFALLKKLFTKVLLDGFVNFFWINQACYLYGANSSSSFGFSCPQFFSPVGTFALWFSEALNPTKLGFHFIQKYFLFLISWVLPWILVCHYSVTRETLLPSLTLQWSTRRDGGPHVPRCWACGRGERSILWGTHNHMGWKGGLFGSCWPSPRGQKPIVPALPSMPLNGAEQHCTGL